MDNEKPESGFSYTVEDEKLKEFGALSYEQRLEWLARMHRFLKKFMPEDSRAVWQKLRGENT